MWSVSATILSDFGKRKKKKKKKKRPTSEVPATKKGLGDGLMQEITKNIFQPVDLALVTYRLRVILALTRSSKS